MQYEEIRCMVCGGDMLERQSDGTYVCKHCRAHFRENDLEEYKETIKGELKGLVTEALLCQRAQDIANIRKNLLEALQEENIDSYKIVGYCRDLKKLLPNDFQAKCFEVLNNGGKKQINAMLESVDAKGEARFYVKDILDFMEKSLTPANLLPLKSLIERALKDAEKTKYLNKIEEEAGKCEAGLYSPEVPRKAFIAYSSKDMVQVNDLVGYLEGEGISCFVALRNMRHGRGAVENYWNILSRAMHNCKSFVLVSTRNSRRFDCDAMAMEIPYVRDNEPRVRRIEYLAEDYGENEGAAKAMLKDFFGAKEQVRNKEDLLLRIMGIEPQPATSFAAKYCLSCGAENAMEAISCKRCAKREFGTKEEYEERCRESERKDAEQKEAERKEAEQKEAARREAERKEAERKEAARREAERKEAEQKEAARREAERKEAERKEAVRREAERKEVERKEAVRREEKRGEVGKKAEMSVAKIDLADFEIKDGVLRKYNGRGGDVIIPNSVTSIGKEAFEYCESLTSITIPDSVTSIGEESFLGCSSLTSITIPDSVTSIGKRAFDGCSGLTSITIPKRVTSIEWSVFSGCSSLTSITIPNSVTSIGENAFEDCKSLTSITIPNSVTSIGDCAFADCVSLISITIPNSVTSIGENAFYGCIGLGEIKVEKGNSVFHSEGNCLIETESKTLVAGCKNSKIPADGSVTCIGECAFDGCKSLTSITIPKRVTSIGDSAFTGCRSLTSITIPNSVTSIGDSAFFGCRSLTSITIPNSVTSIGGGAFAGCESLTSITIPNSVTSIGGSAFADCESLTSITIPNSVTSIEINTFAFCNSLTSVTIPKSVTSVHGDAFMGCSDDLKIYCSGVEPMVWPAGWGTLLKGKVVWVK